MSCVYVYMCEFCVLCVCLCVCVCMKMCQRLYEMCTLLLYPYPVRSLCSYLSYFIPCSTSLLCRLFII